MWTLDLLLLFLPRVLAEMVMDYVFEQGSDVLQFPKSYTFLGGVPIPFFSDSGLVCLLFPGPRLVAQWKGRRFQLYQLPPLLRSRNQESIHDLPDFHYATSLHSYEGLFSPSYIVKMSSLNKYRVATPFLFRCDPTGKHRIWITRKRQPYGWKYTYRAWLGKRPRSMFALPWEPRTLAFDLQVTTLDVIVLGPDELLLKRCLDFDLEQRGHHSRMFETLSIRLQDWRIPLDPDIHLGISTSNEMVLVTTRELCFQIPFSVFEQTKWKHLDQATLLSDLSSDFKQGCISESELHDILVDQKLEHHFTRIAFGYACPRPSFKIPRANPDSTLQDLGLSQHSVVRVLADLYQSGKMDSLQVLKTLKREGLERYYSGIVTNLLDPILKAQASSESLLLTYTELFRKGKISEQDLEIVLRQHHLEYYFSSIVLGFPYRKE